MNVQIETTKYFSVERFQSFKILENSTIMQGFSNPYIALIGRNPFRACFYPIFTAVYIVEWFVLQAVYVLNKEIVQFLCLYFGV